MSQRVRIVSMKHTGAPVFRGAVSGSFSWTRNPEAIAQWLCDGWRTRFNHHRSRRHKHVLAEIVSTGEKTFLERPLGREVNTDTDSQCRKNHLHLASIPAMILQSPERVENTEWFAAAKRRKTNRSKGRDPGRMPGFRSRKRCDQIFVCWHNNGANATFIRCGKRHGIVSINGQNARVHNRPGTKGCRWTLKIRVRLTQDIRPYTSVRVNLTRKELVFVNEPLPHTRPETGPALGVDRGGVIAAATSTGTIHTPDLGKLDRQDKRRKHHQRQCGRILARYVNDAKAAGTNPRAARAAARRTVSYRKHAAKAAQCSRDISRHIDGWAQQTSTEMIRSTNRVVLEDLHVSSMTRSKKGPGHKAKAGMSRSFLRMAPARLGKMLEYKTTLSGGELVYVPAAYTSQRCSACGYTCPDNRESQAVFRCRDCGHTANADTNAARNIADYGTLLVHGGIDLSPESSTANSRNADGSGVVRPQPSPEDVSAFYRRAPAHTAIGTPALSVHR